MVSFRMTSDPHALDILVGDEAKKYNDIMQYEGQDCTVWACDAIASLQWHNTSSPRIVINHGKGGSVLRVNDLREVLKRLDEEVAKKNA